MLAQHTDEEYFDMLDHLVKKVTDFVLTEETEPFRQYSLFADEYPIYDEYQNYQNYEHPLQSEQEYYEYGYPYHQEEPQYSAEEQDHYQYWQPESESYSHQFQQEFASDQGQLSYYGQEQEQQHQQEYQQQQYEQEQEEQVEYRHSTKDCSYHQEQQQHVNYEPERLHVYDVVPQQTQNAMYHQQFTRKKRGAYVERNDRPSRKKVLTITRPKTSLQRKFQR